MKTEGKSGTGLEKIVTILNALYAAPHGLSLGELANCCGLPVKEIRNLLREMEVNCYFPFAIYDEIDSISDRRLSILPADLPVPGLNLSVNEWEILIEILSHEPALQHIFQKISKLFNWYEANHVHTEVVGFPHFWPERKQLETLVVLRQAILQDRKVNFTYSRNSIKRNVEPILLVFFTDRSLWYLLSYRTGGRCGEEGFSLYRLDRIKNIVLAGSVRGYDYDEARRYLSSCWGMETGSLFRVRVLFADVGNVIDKVKRRIAGRSQAVLKPYREDCYVYEDVVAGWNEFRRWLRGFGAACEVLEPPELRQQMLESAQAVLLNYRDINLKKFNNESLKV